uniref:Uncharacterized protein n=1 Tax=Arundo donax TaxID=35708 RepID=A0A0A8ZJH5_ARUDO
MLFRYHGNHNSWLVPQFVCHNSPGTSLSIALSSIPSLISLHFMHLKPLLYSMLSQCHPEVFHCREIFVYLDSRIFLGIQIVLNICVIINRNLCDSIVSTKNRLHMMFFALTLSVCFMCVGFSLQPKSRANCFIVHEDTLIIHQSRIHIPLRWHAMTVANGCLRLLCISCGMRLLVRLLLILAPKPHKWLLPAPRSCFL